MWPVLLTGQPGDGGQIVDVNAIRPAAVGVGENGNGVANAGNRQRSGTINARGAQDHDVLTPGPQLLFGIHAAHGAFAGRGNRTLLGDHIITTIAIDADRTDVDNMGRRFTEWLDETLQPCVGLPCMRWRCAMEQPIANGQIRRIDIKIDLQWRRAYGPYLTRRHCKSILMSMRLI